MTVGAGFWFGQDKETEHWITVRQLICIFEDPALLRPMGYGGQPSLSPF
jgi:hypothetical protein